VNLKLNDITLISHHEMRRVLLNKMAIYFALSDFLFNHTSVYDKFPAIFLVVVGKNQNQM
jgi:hypothetical protein